MSMMFCVLCKYTLLDTDDGDVWVEVASYEAVAQPVRRTGYPPESVPLCEGCREDRAHYDEEADLFYPQGNAPNHEDEL